MKLLEKDIERGFVKEFKKTYPRAICLKMSLRGQWGWPDRMLVMPSGQILFIELKAPGVTRLSPTQAIIQEKLLSLRQKVLTTSSIVEAMLFVNSWEAVANKKVVAP